MNRILTFLGAVLILPIMFACTIPSAINIIGNPTLTLAANMDFDDMLKDMKEDIFANDDFIVMDAVNAPPVHLRYMRPGESAFIQTYVIPIYIFDDDDLYIDIPNPFDLPSIDAPWEIQIASGKIPLPSLSFEGFLEDFKFNGDRINAMLYISGSPLVQAFTMDLRIEDKPITNDGNLIRNRPSYPSNIDTSEDAFLGTRLPPNGVDVSNSIKKVFTDQQDLEIDFDIYIAEGQTIQTSWLGDVEVKVQLVIWLPLILEATKDEAEMEFPEDIFSELGDFIESMADMTNIMVITLDTNVNPFAEGRLILRDDGFGDTVNELGGSKISFTLREEHLEYIRDSDNEPFEPQLFISFNEGEQMSVPREFRITTISVDLDLDIMLDL